MSTGGSGVKTRGKLAAAAAGAVLVTMSTTHSASAESNPADCPKGYVCAWSTTAYGGPALIKTTGNWQGGAQVGAVFNNGMPYPGADHIEATWVWEGKTWSRCLHYNPGPGEYKLTFPLGVLLTSLKWRGECG